MLAPNYHPCKKQQDKMWSDVRDVETVGGKIKSRREGDREVIKWSGDWRGESEDIPEPAVGWRGNSH